MRAMILAAGLGTRLRPLSLLRPKPVLPVRGIPLLAYSLALLRHHGVSEAVVNVHHLPDVVRAAGEAHCPPGLELRFSHEPELLGTGGGIRRVADFLRESDPALILAGDMLLDTDLGSLVAAHREHEDSVTLLLRRDPRSATFGTIGVDAEGLVRRIGGRFDLGGEKASGVYAHATLVSARSLDTLPPRSAFGHLDAWLMPLLEAGARDIRAELQEPEACVWEPVGTPGEYLAANLHPPKLSYVDADAWARSLGARIEEGVVIGAGAELGANVELERVVVWDGERVPDGFRGRDGVYAAGRFHRIHSSGGGEPDHA